MFIFLTGMELRSWAACSSCGGGNATALNGQTGPHFSVSMGATAYGQPAGHLTFGSPLPSPDLFTPALVQFDATSRPDVTVITSNLVSTIIATNIGPDTLLITNLYYTTNDLGTYGVFYTTNEIYSAELISVTNTQTSYLTNPVIRQVMAPQALADIPAPLTPDGFVINFYFPSQITGTNSAGLFLTNGTAPFATWTITNPQPANLYHLQVTESTLADGLLKQWNYSYATNTGFWTMGTRAGIQKNMTVTNLTSDTYMVINTLQYSNGPVAQETRATYQTFAWGVAPIRVETGPASSPKVTTYTYYDPATFGAGSITLKETVVHPDGSQEHYVGYEANGLPNDVQYSFGDNSTGREITYTYSPGAAGVTGSGDNGTYNPTVPRRVIEFVEGTEVSRRYTVFPAADVRLDIQCTVQEADWNDAGNLTTTNRYYTSGPNQYAIKSTIRPDGTMTVYEYVTNALYRTNITVTGQPDSTYAHIVDGVSNQVVLNQWGQMVSSAAWDVKSTLMLSQDIYGNYDSFGRPQQVTHSDGTTETNVYACCGLNYTTDRDGVTTVILYDDDKRQYGYSKFYNNGTGNPISFQNSLDAAGRTLTSYRIGTDSSAITLGQSGYDTAGRLLAQTNALNGKTAYVETYDGTTGGLIRTTTYADGGIKVEAFYQDRSLKSVTGTAVHGHGYGQGVEYVSELGGIYCSYRVVTNLNADGSPTAEWTKTYTDMAGRTVETLYADGSYSQSFYNAIGQLAKQVDPDGVTTLYEHNAKGELTSTVTDLNQDDIIDSGSSGHDRITQTTNDVIYDATYSTTVSRSRNLVWLDGSSTGTLVSCTETATNGLDTWQTKYSDGSVSVTTHSHTVPGVSRTVTTTNVDNSHSVNIYSYGRLQSTARYDSINTQLSSLNYTYDSHGRQATVTDARNGATTYGYNDADQVTSVAAPLSETTTTAYDTMLRPYSVTQPDSTTIYSTYLLTEELGLQYGSRTYPVAYGYDYAGRMQKMTNWSDYAAHSGPRVTTWNYDSQRGWLTSKAYDDGHGPSYTYTPAGRLASRTWVRGVTTSYAYDAAGSLTNILYSDTTPSVTNSYDRLGHLTQQSTKDYQLNSTYNLAGELLAESFSGGILNGLSVTNNYDADLRRSKLSVLNSPSSILAATTYGYDNASRLQTVDDGNNDTATYSYVDNSPLVSQITFKQSGTTRMMTTKTYDHLNRLTGISSSSSFSSSFSYAYNTANQRTKDTLVDGSYWLYSYDNLGQMTGGNKYFADGTAVPGQQFGYGFDDIGNRKQTTAGGNGETRLANYTVNNLNQITARDYPGTNDVVGVALATNAVTVNGQTAWRKGEYFWSTVKSNNTAAVQWEGIRVASGSFTNNGSLYVPQTPEHFGYDADGNLTNDGRWAYVWDAENRLIQMTVNTNVGPQFQLTFAYDAKNRRIQKLVATNNGSIHVGQYTNKFVYDGWNLIAILNPQSSILQSFMWGSDLSGSMQGAGGVGGLLEMNYYGSSTTNCFPAFDGKGNVAALVNAADGTSLASYEYGPFGESIRMTGAMAKNDPFRFSTKYQDDESDLIYYCFRYYKPSTGTWPNRDPIFEKGGVNLYEFVSNSPVNAVDFLGLESLPIPPGYTIEYFYDIRWKCTCICKIAYKDTHRDHSANGWAAFDAQVAELRDQLYRKCDPITQEAHKALCDRLQNVYRAFY
ncbi:MAG: RHS repeat-associated core domain-containing protein [Anaerolineaceae bacterium]|nr:RHS repeat-associated core domain-containing protein [Anaerolineaceae bacterium]